VNLILLQSGYPIANISGETNARLAYYNTLEKCNLEQDKAEFHALIIDMLLLHWSDCYCLLSSPLLPQSKF
jgi:Fic family protein